MSWWKQELASEEEMEDGRRNLASYNNKVDFIVTHCCSTSTQMLLNSEGLYEVDSQTEYLEEIRQRVSFTKWFFGHYHDNRNVGVKELLLYERIIRIV